MNKNANTGHPLEKMNKDNPFKAPEGYFESFPERLNHRMKDKERISWPLIKMYSWKPYLAAAILLIVALVAGNYLFNGRAGNSATKRLHTEISQVVEKELYSISEETILEVLGDEHQNSSGDESASAGEVIDYLLNEDIQENELMNAL
jgi:hypothetical protein